MAFPTKKTRKHLAAKVDLINFVLSFEFFFIAVKLSPRSKMCKHFLGSTFPYNFQFNGDQCGKAFPTKKTCKHLAGCKNDFPCLSKFDVFSYMCVCFFQCLLAALICAHCTNLNTTKFNLCYFQFHAHNKAFLTKQSC